MTAKAQRNGCGYSVHGPKTGEAQRAEGDERPEQDDDHWVEPQLQHRAFPPSPIEAAVRHELQRG